MIGDEELDEEASVPFVAVILEQFVMDGALDKLLLKKLDDTIRPYHEEKSEVLKMETGHVINDVALLKNAITHMSLYMKCL